MLLGAELVRKEWQLRFAPGFAGSDTDVLYCCALSLGFPGGSDDKESACNEGDPGSIPASGTAPGEGVAIHSGTLAWRIPWTEEPGWLQSMGSQRFGHN